MITEPAAPKRDAKAEPAAPEYALVRSRSDGGLGPELKVWTADCARRRDCGSARRGRWPNGRFA